MRPNFESLLRERILDTLKGSISVSDLADSLSTRGTSLKSYSETDFKILISHYLQRAKAISLLNLFINSFPQAREIDKYLELRDQLTKSEEEGKEDLAGWFYLVTQYANLYGFGGPVFQPE